MNVLIAVGYLIGAIASVVIVAPFMYRELEPEDTIEYSMLGMMLLLLGMLWPVWSVAVLIGLGIRRMVEGARTPK